MLRSTLCDPETLRVARALSSTEDQEEASYLAPFVPCSDGEALVLVVCTRLAVDGL